MTTWTPLRDYAAYHHVLGASACYVHPKNGNVYYWACEQKAGKAQDLTIYRDVAKTGAWETVVTFRGTFDAESFIERGGCVIDQTGALRVATTLQPKGVPVVPPKTGFQGVRCVIPNIDEPWTGGGVPGPQGPPGADGNDPRYDALASQLGALSERIAQLQTAGGITLLPAPRTSMAWEGRTLSGGELVDIPAVFGVPSASAYLIRFVASANKADVRVRAGTSVAPYFVTVNTQFPNIQVHAQGWAPGPLCFVSTVNGPATVWFQVLGVGA